MTSELDYNASLDSNGSDYVYEYDPDILEEMAFHRALYERAVPVLFGLICVIGLIGNSMVVLVIIRKRHMNTTANIPILNLAFCDIIFVTVCVPFMTYHYAADNWIFGDVICKLFQFLFYVTVYVTVYILTLVSALRYFTIVHGPKTAKYRTRRNVIILISIIWAVMLIGNCPILFIYRVKSFPVPGIDSEPYYYCGMSSTEVGKPVSVVFFTLTYLVPLTLIATMYLRILNYLNRKRKQSFRLSSRHSTNGTCGGQATERTIHATRIVILVVAVFTACYLPLNVHFLMAYFGVDMSSRAYQIYRMMSHVLAYANSCLNPFVYNYASKDFRQAFKCLFYCWRQDSSSNNTHSTRSTVSMRIAG